ncbi:MAG: hypothetical protein SO206_03685 [Bacilli bacterium]|nr:hypothetical protein [Erysipelotrichaceae bacterium]MDY4819341.1 hypothetical protein [Bacilli bacterium]
MNNYTGAIASFIRFNVVLFNTLEYVMKKDNYDLNAFNARKEIISTEISKNTPLKSCLDNSGEAGTKLLEKIKDLLDTIYGDDSTIVRKSADGKELRVDAAQHIAVFEAVLPIHEEVRSIISAHLAQANKQNMMDEPTFIDVINKEELFYHGLANMLLIDELDHLFAEYNKARNEAKGAITPQSNFISNDINRVVSLMNMLRQRSPIKSNDYYELIDPEFALIEMTSGRRDLPEGKNFGDVFTSVKKIAREKTIKWENEWKPAYDAFIRHFAEEAEKMNNQNAANKA